MSIANGIAGKRTGKPKGIFIHNDAGSINMTATNWERVYKSGWNFNRGFCNYSVDKDYVCEVENPDYNTWHCGSSENYSYLSLEVCQSMGADTTTFLANEDRALKLTAELFKKYNITPNEETVRLHREVYATACPHRSLELHGGTVDSCKKYFIDRIKTYINKKGEDVEMECFVTKGKTIYYYNIPCKFKKAFRTENQYKLMYDMYKKNHGKTLVHYVDDKDHQYIKTLDALIK